MARAFVNLPEYDVSTRIGRGAGALIYAARHRSTRELVAVKHVVRRSPEDDRFIEQAETEYEVASKFEPGALRRCLDLVRIRRWLKTRELFLVMEHVEGVTLESIYKGKSPPDDLCSVVAMFIRIGKGLHAMHGLGYVHADMKPNNILVTSDGVKIIDFGQSCPIGHRKTRVQGTPDFIAPEQVQRDALDARTDVFNLGATMYWVATGKWFRTMLNQGSLAARKIDIDARSGNAPAEELNANVPVPLSKLIHECCEPRAADRPRDMKAVVSRLELILHLMQRKRSSSSRESETEIEA